MMFSLCNFILYCFAAVMSAVGIYYTVVTRSGGILEARVFIRMAILFLSFAVFAIFAIQYLRNFIRKK